MRRLQTWADLAHRQAERARLAAEKSADEQLSDGDVERQPGEPPAHWLERTGRSDPPDHWLEHVRERAPHLLDDDQLQVEPLVAAQPPAPVQPAPGRQPEATQSAVPRTGPLRLIPHARPAEEPAMEKPTVEEPATREPATEELLAAPVAREQRSKKQTPAIRLEPQPAAEPALAPGQRAQPAPIEGQAAPPPPLPAIPKEEAVTPQPLPPQPPSRTQRPVPKPDPNTRGVTPITTARASAQRTRSDDAAESSAQTTDPGSYRASALGRVQSRAYPRSAGCHT